MSEKRQRYLCAVPQFRCNKVQRRQVALKWLDLMDNNNTGSVQRSARMSRTCELMRERETEREREREQRLDNVAFTVAIFRFSLSLSSPLSPFPPPPLSLPFSLFRFISHNRGFSWLWSNERASCGKPDFLFSLIFELESKHKKFFLLNCSYLNKMWKCWKSWFCEKQAKETNPSKGDSVGKIIVSSHLIRLFIDFDLP